ncbi:MAG: hypothetical protein AB8B50_05055 [Pirellulaceae bacterium]
MANTKLALMVASFVALLSASILVPDAKQTEELAERVEQLETQLSAVTTDIQNRSYSDRLKGQWLELDCVQSGTPAIDHDGDGVEWRLATNASCDRFTYRPSGEVDSESFGRFSVDTSKQPVAIDFEIKRDGEAFTVKGIVKQSFGKAAIAIPGTIFDGKTYVAHSRPVAFESTNRNGQRVFTLVRKKYKETGVWE